MARVFVVLSLERNLLNIMTCQCDHNTAPEFAVRTIAIIYIGTIRSSQISEQSFYYQDVKVLLQILLRPYRYIHTRISDGDCTCRQWIG